MNAANEWVPTLIDLNVNVIKLVRMWMRTWMWTPQMNQSCGQCECECHRVNQGHWDSVTSQVQQRILPILHSHSHIACVRTVWGHCDVMVWDLGEFITVRSLWDQSDVSIWGHYEVCVRSLWCHGVRPGWVHHCEVTVRSIWCFNLRSLWGLC